MKTELIKCEICGDKFNPGNLSSVIHHQHTGRDASTAIGIKGKKISKDKITMFNQAFLMTEFPHPQKGMEECSDDVIVDTDGLRANTSFIIAHYDFANKCWVSHNHGINLHNCDLSNMRWMYLPMAHYEK